MIVIIATSAVCHVRESGSRPRSSLVTKTCHLSEAKPVFEDSFFELTKDLEALILALRFLNIIIVPFKLPPFKFSDQQGQNGQQFNRIDQGEKFNGLELT
jgi:hypothetical protein